MLSALKTSRRHGHAQPLFSNFHARIFSSVGTRVHVTCLGQGDDPPMAGWLSRGKKNTRRKNKRSFGGLLTTTAHHKALLLQAFQRFGTLKNSIWITRVDDNELKTNKDRSRVSWWHRYFSALLGWTPGSAVVKTLTREVLRFRHQALSVSDTCSLGSPFVYFPSLFFHRVNHLKLEAFSMETKQSTPRLLKQLWFTSTLDGE